MSRSKQKPEKPAMPSGKDLLVRQLYLICRNYHQFEDSGIIQHLESKSIKNQEDLRQMSVQNLKDLSHELIDIFKSFMALPHMKGKKIASQHFVKYYQPLTTLLKIV